MIFDNLDEIFHAQLDVSLLSVNEEGRHRLKYGRSWARATSSRCGSCSTGECRDCMNLLVSRPKMARQSSRTVGSGVRRFLPIPCWCLKESVVHLPDNGPAHRQLRPPGGFPHRIGVKCSDQRIVMEFQPHFFLVAASSELISRTGGQLRNSGTGNRQIPQASAGPSPALSGARHL